MTKPKAPSDETSIATVPRRSRSSARTLCNQHPAPAKSEPDDPRLTISGKGYGDEDYASGSGRTVRVFDPAAFRAALDEDDAPDDYMGPENERPVAQKRVRTFEDEVWARVVRKIVDDPCEGWRDVLVGDEAMVARLAKAAETAPHFAAVTDLIMRAVIASALTGERVRFPPVLMLSEPGVGKTHYAASIARAMGIRSVPLSLNVTSDRGQLSGLSSAWRGAKMGRFANTVLEGESASPLFLLDEIDKCSNIANENVAAVLLSVLEPENARNFVDEYLDVPIRLDQALWLASANDIQAIPPPLLSRMLVVEVPRPTDRAGEDDREGGRARCCRLRDRRRCRRSTDRVQRAPGEAGHRGSLSACGLRTSGNLDDRRRARRPRLHQGREAEIDRLYVLIAVGRHRDRGLRPQDYDIWRQHAGSTRIELDYLDATRLKRIKVKSIDAFERFSCQS